jgi:CRISPR type III-A-associated RAMP protein Csm4
MLPGFLARFRPLGPWRIGPDSGARNRVDRIYHSDSLYSAVTSAMEQLGLLEEWLAATTAGAVVRFSSLFPFEGDTLYVVPPQHCWPPAPSAKVRWKGARFVPVQVVHQILSEQPTNEEKWTVDGASECLLVADGRSGPFRAVLRTGAAVDRLTGAHIEAHSAACLEFRAGAGLWAAAAFRDAEAETQWAERVKAALHLLADSGFGGQRSRGWGRSEQPDFTVGTLPELLLPPIPPPPPPAEGEAPVVMETAYWMLSLFSPSPSESIDWQRGQYSVLTRGGRIESRERYGELKKPVRMVAEGSVLYAAVPPTGALPNVAPEGFPHAVYRNGYAFSIPISIRQAAAPAPKVTP